MAKATSKDKSATSRLRAQGTPVGARAGNVQAAPDDEMQDDEELQPEESPDPEDIVEMDEEEDVADADDASTDLVVQRAQDRSLTSSAAVLRAPARPAGVPEPLMANPITRFIAESYLELRKVSWPTPQQAWSMTLIVIGMSAAVALILAAADLGLARLLTWVLSLGTGG